MCVVIVTIGSSSSNSMNSSFERMTSFLSSFINLTLGNKRFDVLVCTFHVTLWTIARYLSREFSRVLSKDEDQIGSDQVRSNRALVDKRP